MSDSTQAKTILMGLLGAAVGGCLGYFIFFWMVSQGFYALIVPPALLGLIAGLFARRRSNLLGIICGIAGLLLALFTHWRFNPPGDGSLLFFLTHIHNLNFVTLIMVALGAFFSYRFALGRDDGIKTAKPDVPAR